MIKTKGGSYSESALPILYKCGVFCIYVYYGSAFHFSAGNGGTYHKIQFEFEKTGEFVNGKEKMKRTDNIQSYQVYVATDNHNPFKVKFLPEDKPDLSKIDIGDVVEFEGLEAFENQYGQLFFRASSIKKGK